MIDKFRAWLKSLTEAEKSLVERPVGMSRRGFLRALGITAVSVSAGGLLVPEKKILTLNELDVTTIQWESVGGMQLNFKVMSICVPGLKHTSKHLILGTR